MTRFVKLADGLVNIDAFASFDLWHRLDGTDVTSAYQCWSGHEMYWTKNACKRLEELLLENRPGLRWVEVFLGTESNIRGESMIDVTKISTMGFDKEHLQRVELGPRLRTWTCFPPDYYCAESEDISTGIVPLDISAEDYRKIHSVVQPLKIGVFCDGMNLTKERG